MKHKVKTIVQVQIPHKHKGYNQIGRALISQIVNTIQHNPQKQIPQSQADTSMSQNSKIPKLHAGCSL